MLEESLQLKERLNNEITILKNYFKSNKDDPIPVLIEGSQMYFDPEILIKEKENELKNVDMYYDEYLSVTNEIISLSKNVSVLGDSNEEEDLFYYNGVPFKLKVREILSKLEKDLELAKKQHAELYDYLKKGKKIY